MPNDRHDHEPMMDDFYDATGHKRRFRLSVYAEGLFMEAQEMKGDESNGLRFMMAVKPDHIPPWGEMREKIRERLATRHVVRKPDGSLEILARVVRAQIDSDSRRDEDGLPVLVVDDMEITWEELGRELMKYNGFGLRIEVQECGEE